MSHRQRFPACWAPGREEASFQRSGNLITGPPGRGDEANEPAAAACGHWAGGEGKAVDSRAGMPQCGLQFVSVAPVPLSPLSAVLPQPGSTQFSGRGLSGKAGLRHHAATRMDLWNK